MLDFHGMQLLWYSKLICGVWGGGGEFQLCLFSEAQNIFKLHLNRHYMNISN